MDAAHRFVRLIGGRVFGAGEHGYGGADDEGGEAVNVP